MKNALEHMLTVLLRRGKAYLKNGPLDFNTMTEADKADTKDSQVTNDASERVFGIVDYLKHRFTRLSDRAVSASAMAKINGVWLWFSKLSPSAKKKIWREVSNHKAVSRRMENDRKYAAQVERRRAEKLEEDKAVAILFFYQSIRMLLTHTYHSRRR